MNLEDSKTSHPHSYYLTLWIKQTCKEVKSVALSNLSIYYTWKNTKSLYKNNK